MRVWIKIIINDFQNSVNMNDTLSDNLTSEARWYSTNLININKKITKHLNHHLES